MQPSELANLNFHNIIAGDNSIKASVTNYQGNQNPNTTSPPYEQCNSVPSYNPLNYGSGAYHTFNNNPDSTKQDYMNSPND